LYLTGGHPISPIAILAYLRPNVGIFTGTLTNNNDGYFGQIQYHPTQNTARLTFVLSRSDFESSGWNSLLEGLTQYAGNWGALRVLAEVDEQSPLFDCLRRSGFTIYARQQIWKLPFPDSKETLPTDTWENTSMFDEGPVRNLYQALVPPLVQSAELFPSRRFNGWIYRQDKDLLAYVESVQGPRGIVLNPLVHPSLDNFREVQKILLLHFAPFLRRPIYVAVRSYQAWLTTEMESLSAEPGPRMALMVRHLARLQRTPIISRFGNMEKYSEPTTPALPTHMINKHARSSSKTHWTNRPKHRVLA
jgi:hypothetical protein